MGTPPPLVEDLSICTLPGPPPRWLDVHAPTFEGVHERFSERRDGVEVRRECEAGVPYRDSGESGVLSYPIAVWLPPKLGAGD
jgi:hypothetical protein